MICPVHINYGTIKREIRTSMTLFPVAPFAAGPTEPVICEGLWDTGANSSSISERVARALDLTPVAWMEVETANGWRETPVYKIDVLLPNQMCIKGLHVTESNITACDMLIGMDVISLGDMLLTNKNETSFTFRIPSEGDVPFEKEARP